MKKKVINYLIFITLIVATTWIVLSNNDIKGLLQLLMKTNRLYVLLGIFCMIAYWILNAVIVENIMKMIHTKISYLKAMKITMIGQYYSAITPFASGGQPAQIYHMVNNSVPIGKATSILMIKFIIYQIVVTIYSIIMFAFKWRFVYDTIRIALPFVLIGLGISFLSIFLITGLFFSPKIVKRISFFILNLINKIKTLKKLEQHKEKLEYHIGEYIESINQIRNNKIIALKVTVFTFIQLTLYFGITYYVYLALGFNGASIMELIAIQSLLYMAVSFIPTPGAVGASEGGFHVLFRTFFTNDMLAYAMLLWRGISYYLCLFGGGLVTFIDYLQRKFEKKYDVKPIA